MKKEIRILLLEDTLLDAELIDHELQKGGVQFRSKRVETESEFMHELKHHRPDIILSDHGVPSFDGFAALEKARQICPSVPFIFVTGAQGEEVAVETLKRGADDYVLKSRLHHLTEAIQRALDRPPQRAGQTGDRARHPSGPGAHREPLDPEYAELQELTHRLALEIRTPLRHIDSLVELLQKSAANLDTKSRQSLKHISESAGEIGRLTDELLRFTRLGQMPMYKLHFSLSDLVNEAVQDLRAETDGRDIEWVIGKLPEVVGDPAMLAQAVDLLLSNALKFTRKRQRPRIEISAETTAHDVVLSVADNGVGFAARHREKLFKIFQRLHAATVFEGYGLGLANVRRIVQRHGGRVWAEGSEDAGATFFVALPREPESPRRK
jgi:two-component system, sensor histidine kinase and response regulator